MFPTSPSRNVLASSEMTSRIPGVEGGAPQIVVGVITHTVVGQVGSADRYSPRLFEMSDDRCVVIRHRILLCHDSVCRR